MLKTAVEDGGFQNEIRRFTDRRSSPTDEEALRQA
jgi:hypothetical protein